METYNNIGFKSAKYTIKREQRQIICLVPTMDYEGSIWSMPDFLLPFVKNSVNNSPELLNLIEKARENKQQMERIHVRVEEKPEEKTQVVNLEFDHAPKETSHYFRFRYRGPLDFAMQSLGLFEDKACRIQFDFGLYAEVIKADYSWLSRDNQEDPMQLPCYVTIYEQKENHE